MPESPRERRLRVIRELSDRHPRLAEDLRAVGAELELRCPGCGVWVLLRCSPDCGRARLRAEPDPSQGVKRRLRVMRAPDEPEEG